MARVPYYRGACMEWLLIVALAAWVYVQGREQKDLRRRLSALERRRDASTFDAPAVPRPPVRPSTVPAVDPAPKLVDRVAPPLPEPVEPIAAPTLRPPRPKISITAWLSEHGLAWLGGGALALGGLFLATYAAQRGVFTPALRITLAVVVGLAMVGASEWLRRRVSERGRGPAAALLAGAGAATLYGAVWASDRLYGFIGLPVSAPLLAIISAGLLVLAFRHGMPLALVALFGAYLAPVVTNGPDWGDAPLAAYLLLILATGYGVAALRGWREAAWGASLGAVAWGVANLGDAGDLPTATLLVASPLAAIIAGLWRRRTTGEAEPLRHAAAAALVLSVLAAPALWLQGDPSFMMAAAATWAALALLAAVVAGWRLEPGFIQSGVYAMAGLAMLLGAFELRNKVDATWPLAVVILGLVSAGALAVWRARDDRARLYASVAPAAAAFVLVLLTLGLDADRFAFSWAAPAIAAAAIAAVAAWLGRRLETPSTDLSLALWIWSAAALAGRALFAGLVLEWAAPGAALLALACVGLRARLEWRGLAAAAVAATTAALVAVAVVGVKALEGDLTVLAMSLAFALATLSVWGASRIARTRDAALADALSTGALIIGLMGLFFLLRLRATSDGGNGLELLLEVGLGVVLLLATGLMTARGAGQAAGPIGKWRAQAFMLAGLAYGAFTLLLIFNPFWNKAGLPIKGPPLLDSLLAAYLAPAALLAVAARRAVTPLRVPAAVYAGGAILFALTWAVLELRRLFRGPGFAWGPETIGRAEGAAYALLLILAALGLSLTARLAAARPAGGSLIAGDLARAGKGLEWAALGVGALVFGYCASPWWGPITRPLDDHAAAILLLGLYAAGAAGWLVLARRPQPFGAAARVAAALQLFLLLTLAVRYGFRGLDMHTAVAEARMETWAFSALWAVYGLAVLAFGARRGDIALRWAGLGLLLFTTTKVFLFDMARLDGMIRAASFLAVGALLIVAALAARRFGGIGAVARPEEKEAGA